MVARLMPKASSPINASPDSFNKIRLWAGRASDMGNFLELAGTSVKRSDEKTTARVGVPSLEP
jgi:hypothetical protein